MATNRKAHYIVTISRCELFFNETWYSRSYGVREKNLTLRITSNAIFPTELRTVIRPGQRV